VAGGGRWLRRGGRPSWTAAAPLKNSFFQFFFVVSTSFHPLLLISTLKTFTIQIVNLRSKKERKKETLFTFWIRFRMVEGVWITVVVFDVFVIVVAVICATAWLFVIVTVLVVV